MAEELVAFGSSEYAKEVLGGVWGAPPPLRLEAEAGLQRLLAVLAARGLVHSARDISDGGIAVALAQSAFPNDIGAAVEQEPSLMAHPLFGLFAEPASTVLVTADAAALLQKLKTLAAENNIFAVAIGATGGNRLEITVDREPVHLCSARRAAPALGHRPRIQSPRRGPCMTQRLYQGVEGVRRPARTESCVRRDFRGARIATGCIAPRDHELPIACAQRPKLHEECGVMAIYGHPDAAREAYLGLYALQHRGQESAGIATADGQRLANIKGMGLVSEIFTDDVLAKLPGTMAIGHTRYSTTGDSALLNAQPIRVDSTKGLIAIAHNGNLVNLGNLRVKLEREGAYFQTTSDSEIIVQLIAHSHAGTLVDAIADSLSQVEGAFSIVMMTRDRIFAARDPRGFRPLSMGRIKNPGGPDTVIFASETCAFDLLRAEYLRDVLPGELVMVTEDGVTSRQYASGVAQASCIFEHVYFSRPDSRVFGRWVQESRDRMGRQLARESGVPADVVVPVPDSGVTAALGYAEEAGIPFRFGLIRNHYVGRTFIAPEQRVRDFGVRLKLNPVHNLLEGKRVILIDDSIIRGTTSRKIVRMVRGAGAKEVHLRISCPPTVSPCFYGVDTPSKRDLIAANQSIEEIRQFIEADSLAYLSLEGLLASCDGGEGNRLLRRLLHRQLPHPVDRRGRDPAGRRHHLISD